MKKITFILIALFAFSIANAQKKDLTISEAVSSQYRFIYPGQLVGLKWLKNTEMYSYVSEYKSVYAEPVLSKRKSIVVNMSDVNKALTDIEKDTMQYFYTYSWKDANTLIFDDNTRYIQYNFSDKKIKYTEKPENAEGFEYCEENDNYAFTIDNNLYIFDDKGEKLAITNDKNKNIVNGQTVSRSEFGIVDGIFWSPKGNFLAFYKKDETDVTDYPLIDISTVPASLKNTKYPMAGSKSEYIKIGIYNTKTKSTIFLDGDGEQRDQYLINPTWSPDEKYIILARLNREQNHAKIELFDAQSGKLVKTLFEEKSDKWVEPEKESYFIDNNTFVWQSERDGFNHMYLYDIDGNLKKQLTKGNWLVTEIKDYDAEKKELYYMSTENSPLENNLYSINIETGKTNRITKVDGTHNVGINIADGLIIDGYSNTKTPRVYDIIDTKGNIIKNLKTADNPLTDYNISMPEIGKIKADDGKTDLYYRLIKPTNFDKNKKYPVIVYLYGGPHAQMTTNSWMAGGQMWLYYMAEKGYVVFTVDNRGSANRGFEFESAIHRNVGQNEMKDQIKGIEFLKKLAYVDENRIGVHGWSFGGFMTVSLSENYPDIFKVAVAGGPVTDWKFYEIMYGERYMDMPKENPEGYELTSTLDKVDKIKGDLLIIHGGVDATVVPQQSYQLLRECIKKDIQVDFFTYPTHEHNVRGKNRDHLMGKITKYFEDNL
jgi:dipeptidyl-peptidase-4